MAVDKTENHEGLRIARYCSWKSCGLVVGVMTVAYIVLSLARLVP
jgi:hypothetical protein